MSKLWQSYAQEIPKNSHYQRCRRSRFVWEHYLLRGGGEYLLGALLPALPPNYPFSITKHYNIENKLSSIAQSFWAVFSRNSQLLKQYGESTLPVLISQEGQCRICNWECLYCYSSQKLRYNIAWAHRKSLSISLRLMLYFIVYPSSCSNTDTIYA